MKITEDSDNIKIVGHAGYWHVIDSKMHLLRGAIFLLEHSYFGDDAASLIVDENGNVLLEMVYNGLEEIDY